MRHDSEDLKALGAAIRKVREEKGFSQDKFALEVGVGRSYYGCLERGEINVSALTLIKIMRALDSEVNHVFPDILI